MPKYKAVLFAPDGDWVTDFRGDTIKEVQEKLADSGSRWFFYPYVAIILDKGDITTNRQRLIEADPEIGLFQGQAIKTVGNYLKTLSLESSP